MTGSAHCALAPFWTDRLRSLPKTAPPANHSSSADSSAEAPLVALVGYQASARGGAVRVVVDGDRVRLSGHAVTTMRCRVLV